MSYTILMPVFNASAVVSRTLRYLLETGVAAQNVIVADDGSTDPEMADLASWAVSRGMRWERSDENLGYTLNVNRGLRVVETDQVLVLNSDCFISRQSVDKLAAVLHAFELIGCVGPLSSDAGHQTVPMKRHVDWLSLDEGEVRSASEQVERRLAERFGQRPWLMPTVNGFCCLWKMEALREAGFFDGEEFPRGYGEEDDACLRLMTTGRFPAILPCAFAPHLKTRSFSTRERDALKGEARNKLRRKFSDIYIERLSYHNKHSPHLAELRRVVIDV